MTYIFLQPIKKINTNKQFDLLQRCQRTQCSATVSLKCVLRIKRIVMKRIRRGVVMIHILLRRKSSYKYWNGKAVSLCDEDLVVGQ